MPDIKPEDVDAAAANVMSEPYAYLQLAKEYVERDTGIPLVAFGAVGMPMVLSAYNPARDRQLDNLRAGVAKLQEMAEGLARVAASWRNADEASSPVGRTGLTSYVAPDGRNAGRNIGEGAILAAGLAAVKLLPHWIACNRIAGTIGKLERVAWPMVGIWALCMPLDDPIERAEGAWTAARNQLDTVPGALETALAKLADWQGDDRDAFDRWMTRFTPEFADASQAAGKTAEALTSAKNTIVGFQTTYFLFCVSILTTMILLMVAEKLPYVGTAAAVAKKVLAVMAVAGTAGFVAGVANALNSTLTALPGLIQSGEFGKLTINAAGGGVGFKDVPTDFDDRLARIAIR